MARTPGERQQVAKEPRSGTILRAAQQGLSQKKPKGHKKAVSAAGSLELLSLRKSNNGNWSCGAPGDHKPSKPTSVQMDGKGTVRGHSLHNEQG